MRQEVLLVKCSTYLQVHKCLLAATSDYFRVMLSGINTESQQNMVDLKGLNN